MACPIVERKFDGVIVSRATVPVLLFAGKLYGNRQILCTKGGKINNKLLLISFQITYHSLWQQAVFLLHYHTVCWNVGPKVASYNVALSLLIYCNVLLNEKLCVCSLLKNYNFFYFLFND